MKDKIALNRNRHDRDSAGFVYIYPVLSRRAQGISVGINLNTNNACNWRCIYCQVPNLTRGAAPDVDVALLEKELHAFLTYAEQNQFAFYDDDGVLRPVVDICFSGNGEPTASPKFAEVVESVLKLLEGFQLQNKIKLVVISNGSEIYKADVQTAMKKLSQHNGEIWFKIDAGCEEDWKRINQTHLTTERVLKHLEVAVGNIPTRIQTCVFGDASDKINPAWQKNYLALLKIIKSRDIKIRDVLIYSVARPPQLPEGANLMQIPQHELNTFGLKVEELGFEVQTFQA